MSNLFSTVFTDSFTLGNFLAAVLVSLILGLAIALFYRYKNACTASFIFGLILIPALETVVIMIVNDNLGMGLSVAGSFALIRFRSVKGDAKDLTCIFMAMVAGILCGTGYLALAFVFMAIILVVGFMVNELDLSQSKNYRTLRITVPESLNYENAFNDILKKYTKNYSLESVKTLALGSLYRLQYQIELKNANASKAMIDELRTRNGNLEIMMGLAEHAKEEL